MNDDMSRRLDSIEKVVVEIRTMLDTVLPHLATKAELAPVLAVLPHLATKAELAPVLTALPHLATKAELAPVVASSARFATKDELQAMRSDLIAWIVGTALTSVAVLAGLMTLASRLSWH
jgi:hypothetical protein